MSTSPGMRMKLLIAFHLFVVLLSLARCARKDGETTVACLNGSCLASRANSNNHLDVRTDFPDTGIKVDGRAPGSRLVKRSIGSSSAVAAIAVILFVGVHLQSTSVFERVTKFGGTAALVFAIGAVVGLLLTPTGNVQEAREQQNVQHPTESTVGPYNSPGEYPDSIPRPGPRNGHYNLAHPGAYHDSIPGPGPRDGYYNPAHPGAYPDSIPGPGPRDGYYNPAHPGAYPDSGVAMQEAERRNNQLPQSGRNAPQIPPGDISPEDNVYQYGPPIPDIVMSPSSTPPTPPTPQHLTLHFNDPR
ncbi:hypothetical protein SeLEV6574_g07026 [Synchytrium endobioticum]|nr:hypothetical protein SeLEV6574_g07026 [Synchytrium endobioticum]